MMKIRIVDVILLSALLVMFSPYFSNAQSLPGKGKPDGDRPSIGIITGKLIDEETQLPVEYGSVALISMRDSSLAGGTISNSKGYFRIEQIKPGRYIVRIQFIGYETKFIQGVMIKPDHPEVNLGLIKMQNHIAKLEGVEVIAEKEMMVNNLDKKIIHVDKTIAAVGGNAVDVMQSIPSVTVDIDGNVSLRGSGNVTILIDGKPSGLNDLSSGELLQQIPASSIESVEVITNPSVRYDPEGTSGILNIILKKKSLQGFNGLISATAGTGNRYNGSVNLNIRQNRMNAYAGFDARLGQFRSTRESDRISSDNDVQSRLFQTQEMVNERNSYNLNTGLDFTPDNFNTMIYSFQYRNMNFGNEGDILSRTYMNDSLIRTFSRTSLTTRTIESFNYNASYRRTFETKGKELTVDMMFNNNKMEGYQDIHQTDLQIQGTDSRPDTLKTLSSNRNRLFIVQGNFILPLGVKGRIEAGFKSSLKALMMESNRKDYNYDSLRYILNPLASNNFDYSEQIHAVYGIYSASAGKLKYQAGLRVEQLISDSKLELTNEKFTRSYPGFYPSLHVVYEKSVKNQFILSYSRRVSRPNHRQLNPFVDYSDSLNIRYGNPRLDPEFIHSCELGWTGYWGKNSINSTLFYRYTTGMIENIVTLQPNGVTSATFENLTSGSSYGLEMIANREFATWVKANANLSFFFREVNGSEIAGLQRVEGFMWTSKVNLSFNLFKGGSLLVSGNYQSAEIEAQDREEEVYFADAAFKYDFLKGKASLSLRVSDVFNTRQHNAVTKGESFYITSTSRVESRIGYLGFTYRINNYSRQKEKDRNGQSDMEMDEF